MSQTRVEGTIRKALSGFYYVQTEQTLVTCRARGKFRYQKVTPLVGDRVAIALQPDGSGSLVEILPRRNAFQRPAVANLDQLVIIASGAVPVSDPFLLDRIISLAERKGCEPILCINKWDLVPAGDLSGRGNPRPSGQRGYWPGNRPAARLAGGKDLRFYWQLRGG